MTLIVQNILLFQIGWFACVLGGASEYSIIGVPTVLAIIVIHLVRSSSASEEISLILLTTLFGTLWDSALTTAGLFSFSNGVFINGLAPHWLIAMWALFATTLNVSLKWFKGKWFLSAVFGAAGGAAAYYAGYRLGAVEFSNTGMVLTIVAAGWFFIMPLLLLAATYLNGYAGKPRKNDEVWQHE